MYLLVRVLGHGWNQGEEGRGPEKGVGGDSEKKKQKKNCEVRCIHIYICMY